MHAAAARQIEGHVLGDRGAACKAARPGGEGVGSNHAHTSPRHGARFAAASILSGIASTVTEQIRQDVTVALKGGDRERATALRLVLAELQKDAKEGTADEQSVLRRERKRRRDAEVAFREAGRAELADKEAAEGELIDTYLPSQLSDAELQTLVIAAVEETNAQSMRDMGTVIKHVMAAAAGRAEGARVSALVKEQLGS